MLLPSYGAARCLTRPFHRTSRIKLMDEKLKGSGSVLFTAENEAQPRGETGWTRVGRFDDSQQRAMWTKISLTESPFNPEGGNVQSVELCSGKEGRDSHVKFTPDNPAFDSILDCVLGAEFAISLRSPRKDFRSAVRQESRVHHSKTIAELTAALDALHEHVCGAAPLSWASVGDMEAAALWETRLIPLLCSAMIALQRSRT